MYATILYCSIIHTEVRQRHYDADYVQKLFQAVGVKYVRYYYSVEYRYCFFMITFEWKYIVERFQH